MSTHSSRARDDAQARGPDEPVGGGAGGPPSGGPDDGGLRPAHEFAAPLDRFTPQLTLRALLTGMALGSLLSACNIYTGLKIGWGTNVSVISVLFSFVFWGIAQRVLGTRPWTILENNLNQAAASAAGAVSSAGLVAAVPALTMLTGQKLEWHWLALWIFSVCLVGITVAVPIRRQMVVVDKLPFPAGIATAYTLREMYARGSEAFARVTAMLVAGALSVVFALWTEYGEALKYVLGRALKPEKWGLPIPPAWLAGFQPESLKLQLEPTLLFPSVGALIGMRACVSLLLGAVLAWGVIAPPLIRSNHIRLKTQEPLGLLPVGVAEQLRPEPEGYLRYRPEAHALEFKGRMTAAERDSFAALSSDRRYREAIERIFSRSQLAPAAPAGIPATVDLLTFEPLERWPVKFALPHSLDWKLRFAPSDGGLLARGVVSPALRTELQAVVVEYLKRAPQEQRAATALLAAADRLVARTAKALPDGLVVPEALRERVTIDPAARELRAVGRLSAQDGAALAALAADDADWKRSVAALVSASALKMTGPNFPDVLEWLLWPGVTLMVVSSLVSFSFSGRALLRAMVGLGGADRGAAAAGGDVARGWFVASLLAALALSVVLQVVLFGIAWWAAALGVLLSFLLAIVATRVTGETNSTPVGAMGKITQLMFGVLTPGNPVPNLMAANVTGGAASQCADLMHDLKTGYMLGATAWKQAISQACGALAGAMVGSLFYLVMIPDPSKQLLTTEWPAPAVATWKAVAEIFAVGLKALPAGALTAIVIAAAVGVLLPVLEHYSPRRVRAWLPSSASVGLAFVISAANSISMFLGGLVAWLLALAFPRWSGRFLVVIASGLIAGESLTGVGISVQKFFWPEF